MHESIADCLLFRFLLARRRVNAVVALEQLASSYLSLPHRHFPPNRWIAARIDT
jgi:hypothetical protein